MVIKCAHTTYDRGGEHVLAVLDVVRPRIPQNVSTPEKDKPFRIVIDGVSVQEIRGGDIRNACWLTCQRAD